MEPIDYKKVFGSPGEHNDWVREYLRDLRQNWAAAEATITRSVAIITALAAVFVLVAVHGVGEVAILGVKITHLSPVEAAIPVITTYLLYAVAQNAATSTILTTVHDDLCQYYWPAFYEQNLELTLRPAGSFVGFDLAASNAKNSLLASALSIVDSVRFVVCLLGPLTFSVYAMVWLWEQTGMPAALAAISTVLTTALLLAAIPSIVAIAVVNYSESLPVGRSA